MNIEKLSQISTIFIGLILFFIILNQFQSFLRPFVIAIILTFLFVPFTRLSSNKKRTIWLITLIIIMVLFIIIVVFTALFTDSTNNEVEITQNNFGTLLPEENPVFFGYEVDIRSLFNPEEASTMIKKFISTLVSSVGSFFSEALLTLLFLFFLLPTHDKTIDKFAKSMSEKNRKEFKDALSKIEKSIRDYLSVKTIISLATAFFTFVVLIIFGVKYALFFSFLVFLLNFIPSIGSIVAVGIILFVELITTQFTPYFFLLAFLLILIQTIFGNVIEPKIAGEKLSLSPVIVLLSLFFWGSVWGIGGMFFAVPLTSIIKIILQHLKFSKKIINFIC